MRFKYLCGAVDLASIARQADMGPIFTMLREDGCVSSQRLSSIEAYKRKVMPNPDRRRILSVLSIRLELASPRRFTKRQLVPMD